MAIIRNLFAVIGLLAVIVGLFAGFQINQIYQTVQTFDPGAVGVYQKFSSELLRTGNAAEASIWKLPVAEGVSAEDVVDTMQLVANQHNFKNVGELPLSAQIEAMTGEPQPELSIYLFCDPIVAGKMIAYNAAYSAYLPCRISLVEDDQGKLWLYTLNLDPMIYGGKTLPIWLKEEATRVRDIILDIMQKSAAGAF